MEKMKKTKNINEKNVMLPEKTNIHKSNPLKQ